MAYDSLDKEFFTKELIYVIKLLSKSTSVKDVGQMSKRDSINLMTYNGSYVKS